MAKAERRAVPTPLPVLARERPPATRLGRWLIEGASPEEAGPHHESRPWWQVLWLTGVDYFSTLGYQPGIALLAAGALSPVATLILVAVTILCALPVYAAVAGRSYRGQGSIAMLERLLGGWRGKFLVLGLLGFAATDFVITMTLSSADAAVHIVENPYLHGVVGDHALGITLVLLALLAAVFLRGFGEAIGIAVLVGIPYMLLNAVVVGRGLYEIARDPSRLDAWSGALSTHGDWTGIVLLAALVFPKLALGMSGFETGVSVMPLVRGGPEDDAVAPGSPPTGRIRATRILLGAAAGLMSLMLLGTSFVTTLLVPEAAWKEDGPAAGRAMAWLAHDLLGSGFGSVYDASTIAILWFAGASAMAGLLNLVPRYLPRFGMAPAWVEKARPLVLVLFGVDVGVTLVFQADVEAQGGAYATGVLVLMLSAAVAVALACGAEARERGLRARAAAAWFWVCAVVFGYTLVENVLQRPDGVIIASVFVVAVLLSSALSRYLRSTEFRVESIRFSDPDSEAAWPLLVGKKVSLVPLRTDSPPNRAKKAREIRKYYKVSGPIAFLHVRLSEDPSQFTGDLQLEVSRVEGDFVVRVDGAVAVANTVAYVSELVDPVSIFLGLTRGNPMSQAFKYLTTGEGETGLLVYQILVSYWDWTPEEDVRPLIFLMSE